MGRTENADAKEHVADIACPKKHKLDILLGRLAPGSPLEHPGPHRVEMAMGGVSRTKIVASSAALSLAVSLSQPHVDETRNTSMQRHNTMLSMIQIMACSSWCWCY